MVEIRMMTSGDAPVILGMMRTFYASPAVLSNGSEEIFARDIEACVSGNPLAQGFVFEEEGKTLGYGMIVHSFSTEFGRPCVWIEDLYLAEGYRGRGIGSRFIQFVRARNPEAVIRLEVERDNRRAVETYRRNGMEELPYMEMILHPGK